jgi:hypothetical protein
MLLTKYFLAGNLILGKRYCLWQSRGIFISLERRLLVHVGFAIPRVRENVFMDRIEPYLSHAAGLRLDLGEANASQSSFSIPQN